MATGPMRTGVDPGLQGCVPFRFHCQRSGRCCSMGEGYVWVEEDEVEAMAGALGLDHAPFAQRFLREVPDPRTSVLRTSLREEQGRCILLEGARQCTVYEARPQQCRSFPYWPGVLADGEVFERARAVCPGIAVEVTGDLRARGFAALEALYEELDGAIAALAPRCELSGLCCRFEEAGHDLYATGLEADYAAHLHPRAPEPAAPGRCPYHVDGRCTAREGRALGCRTYYCDPRTRENLETLHERFLGRVRALEQELDYPAAYGRFPAQLAARGVGRGVGRDSGSPANATTPSAQGEA